MKKIIIPVKGMHCKSCEMLIESAVGEIKGVQNVTASTKKAIVEIEYDNVKPNLEKIKQAIQDSGYSVIDEQNQHGKVINQNNGNNSQGAKFGGNERSILSSDPSDYMMLISIGLILFVAYKMLQMKGINLGGFVNSSSPSLSAVFLIGLTAGVSSCMAVVGGLILAVSSRWNQENMDKSASYRFAPHIYFNMGRVVGFGILGGLLGLLGGVIGISDGIFGVMTLIVGGLMVLLGLNLTGISPYLSGISISLPKSLSKGLFGDEGGKKGAMLTGALSFFLPCGFTFAMQAYAMTTKSFMLGGAVMAVFALGTLPGLIGIGGLTSLIRGAFSNIFFKVVGVLVVMLGVFNISNSMNIMALGSSAGTAKQGNVTIDSNLPTQEIRITQDGNGYNPTNLKIRPNSNIHLIINSKDQWTCASTFTIPSLGIKKSLNAGENVIDFVSPKSGIIDFSCIMGMYTGKFVVSDDVSGLSSANTAIQGSDKNVSSTDNTSSDQLKNCGGNTGNGSNSGNSGTTGRGMMRGCNMMGGNSSTSSNQADSSGQSFSNGLSSVSNNQTSSDIITINMVYGENGLTPNPLILKKGQSYQIVIDSQVDVYGCMEQIMIPGLDEKLQYVKKGNKIVFNVKTDVAGNYQFTCAMGLEHGKIIIE